MENKEIKNERIFENVEEKKDLVPVALDTDKLIEVSQRDRKIKKNLGNSEREKNLNDNSLNKKEGKMREVIKLVEKQAEVIDKMIENIWWLWLCSIIFITLLTSLLVIVKAIQEYKEKKKTEFTFETFLKCMQADVDSGVFDTEEYKKFAEEMLKRGTNEEKIY